MMSDLVLVLAGGCVMLVVVLVVAAAFRLSETRREPKLPTVRVAIRSQGPVEAAVELNGQRLTRTELTSTRSDWLRELAGGRVQRRDEDT